MNDSFMLILKQKLDQCIEKFSSERHLYCRNPKSDFTRTRKISFSDVVHFLIEMQSKSLPNEVMEYFGHSLEIPTVSAVTQQRDKILPSGWEHLFALFRDECTRLYDPLYQGYRLLACDGSDVNIARDPDDQKTFITEGETGYNAIHINALYNPLSLTYYGMTFQGKKKLHERSALNRMVDSYVSNIPSIFIADRGYESFNVFAHILRSGHDFIIRIKDTNSNGILGAYDLPDGEFDMSLSTTLTRRHTKETLNNPDKYTILSPATDFDFFENKKDSYDISFRIVRFIADDGKYVCIATSLSEEEFPLEKIRELYHLRWGEETSFRELKYTIGLINFHTRKKDSIIQEILARTILYNFCQMVNTRAARYMSHIKSPNGKYRFKIDFATTVNICRSYLKYGGDEIELLLLICKHVSWIKCNAKYPIHLRPKRNKDFVYRVA